ncbi:hypothetical protein B0T14DRAFT_8786 [Immersiella caudata]|uniref:Secreted protein n=1 Tax=Immersiella caudata TaxID=314043 RepID=A0AA40CBR3_9PEZI|nr:hypothetical protein B0T14DRAFT_8786 [Immersiella caudata]
MAYGNPPRPPGVAVWALTWLPLRTRGCWGQLICGGKRLISLRSGLMFRKASGPLQRGHRMRHTEAQPPPLSKFPLTPSQRNNVAGGL